mgnify:CR=1 FL=1
MKAIDVSLIVPTYNRKELLRKTLNSVLNQEFNEIAIEIIIVDDGSSDGTKELVEEFLKLGLDLKYIYQEDQGFRVSLARNKGILSSKGAICILIDSGVILSKNFIQEHFNLHSHSTSNIVVIGYVLNFDNENKFEREFIEQFEMLGIEGFINKNMYNPIFQDIREVLYKKYEYKLELLPASWVFFWTCNVSMKREILIEAGMFDTNYDQNWGMEDIDLGYRLSMNGYKFYLNKKALCIHYPHFKDKANNFKEQAVNKLYFQKKFESDEVRLFMDVTWELNDYIKN